MLRSGSSISALIFLCSLASLSSCARWERSGDSETLHRILKHGNEALIAKQYDEAIKLFDAGLAISPREPAFLISKSTALRARGVDRYNASIKLSDQRAKAVEMDAAKQDFGGAAILATEAVNLMKSVPRLVVLLEGGSYKATELAAFRSRAEAMRLLSKVDNTQADAALSAFHEYIAIETDQTKKTKAQLDAGRMLLDTGRGEQAAAEYQKTLADDPNNIDAFLGLGLALFQSGDSRRYREAALYLQRFVDQAPDNHPLKASAKETLGFMKRQDVESRTR